MSRISILAFYLIATLSFTLQSCQSVDKGKVKETVEKFFEAYRNEDVATAQSIYPNIFSLRGDFRKSSNIDLNTDDIEVVNDSNIVVNLTHHWINPFGVDNSSNIRLYMCKKGDQYEIIDSKNFCMYDNKTLYNFACKVGAVKLYRDMTDIAISEGISNAETMFYFAKERVHSEIRAGLNVSMNWDKGYYNDYASGRGVVTNNTNYPIKNPKYTVTYYKHDAQTIVTSDNGTVCYNILMPNESRSFSWYTSYVGNASKAGVTVDCDDDWLDEITANLPFQGFEYDNYRRGTNWWPF